MVAFSKPFGLHTQTSYDLLILPCFPLIQNASFRETSFMLCGEAIQEQHFVQNLKIMEDIVDCIHVCVSLVGTWICLPAYSIEVTRRDTRYN